MKLGPRHQMGRSPSPSPVEWACHTPTPQHGSGCGRPLRTKPLECQGRCDGLRFCADCLRGCERCGARPMCDSCASYESLRFGCEFCHENVCTECAGENFGYGFCCQQIACQRCVAGWGRCETCGEPSCARCLPKCPRCRMPPPPPPPSRLRELVWSYERLYSGHPLWISPGSVVGRLLNLLPIALLAFLAYTLPPLLATHWRQSSPEARERFGWATAGLAAAAACGLGVCKYREAREEEALIVKLTEHMTKRRAAKLNAAQG